MTTAVAVSSKDMAHTSLVQDFKTSLLPVIEKEKALWLEMVGYMVAETLSVRGCKATIEAVNAEAGALPTIAVSSAQYFLSAGVVHSMVKGADSVSLSDLLNTTIQGTRKLGKKRFAELVEVASSFKALSSTVEQAPAKEKAEKAEKVEGIDGHMLALLGLLEAEDFDGIIKNIELAEKVLTRLGAQVKLSKQANHPSVRVA